MTSVLAITVQGESEMQTEKRCARCKHGRHKEHQADFRDRAGQVTLCRCLVCVPASKVPTVAEVEMAQ